MTTIEVTPAVTRIRLRLTSRIDQAHADATAGMDVSRLGSRLAELLAEPREVHVDGLVGASVRLVPYLGQQLALADHATGPFDEVRPAVRIRAP